MPVAETLSKTTDLRTLTRLLGLRCVGKEIALDAGAREHAWVAESRDEVAGAVMNVPTDLWAAGDFSALLEISAVRSRLEDLEELDAPQAELSVLRGMCERPLHDFFERTHELIELEKGDIYPLPDRPVHEHVPNPSPHWSTIDYTEPLGDLNFRIWPHPSTDSPRVQLDYQWREALDAATWPEGRDDPLPRVASVHPYASFDDLRVGEWGDGWWFHVEPRNFDLDDILTQLERVADCDAAILPELSLPEPGALTKALAGEAHLYPPLVVAGSAHVKRVEDGRERRSNEARAYLSGIPLLTHRKKRPLRYKRPGTDEGWLPEGLTQEPKVLTLACGDRTRLAVVICADLNERGIPRLLIDAGANYLLVPALTPGEGTFGATAATLACMCQGFTVMVNGAPPPDPDRGEAFMLLAGVPTEVPQNQVRSFPAPDTGRRAIGRLDLNRPLSEGPNWTAS